MRRVRALSDAERALWAQVAATVSPRRRASKAERQAADGLAALAANDAAQENPAKAVLAKALVTKDMPDVSPSGMAAKKASSPAPPPLAPIERRLRQQLSRGRRSVDAKIDLHGMRQEEAHDALLRFVARAQAMGAGLLLVVTGKGGLKGRQDLSRQDRFFFTERDRGVLHRMVPLWLSEPAMRRYVIGFEPASPVHGGNGALYVRVRQAR